MKNVKNIKADKGINKKIISPIVHRFYRSRCNNKGVIDAQFNWIFVLIAGFVIFLFIISIIFTQKNNAEKQASISTINQVTTLLKSKQQTANVYSEISLPRTDINFRCDPDTKYFTFKIANAERTQLPVEIIFAPESISANKLMVWSQEFDLGFPVGVFIYVTTGDSIILIYNDSTTSDYAAELYNGFDSASNITHKYISSTDEYSGFKRRMIVCFEGYCPTGTNDEYVKITPAPSGLFEYGNVTFHRKGIGNDKKLPYITKAGLYGAVFSDSPEYYSCQMSRVFEQFEVKRTLVESRSSLIQAELQKELLEGICQNTLGIINTDILYPMNNPEMNYDNIVLLYDKSKDLDKANVDLKLSSCPTIY
jgi:hypothetical protein